ncbi:uncharacterized mitochondrial protein AtMg00240-like [Rutidosis leptorrhynchoides]|uniref:uncharacterized mitochondrial protein AtMg00240-like n=1 Tax=Rutidosis leptorrhynchoides TaxID=125765 RepID=UPI003A9A3B12
MTQRKYALELLYTAGILDEKPSNVSIDRNVKLTADACEILPDATLYRKLVGKLIYLTITDLKFYAQHLSQFSQAPRTTHLQALYKVLRYIKLCPAQGLNFPSKTNLILQAYCDSEWGTTQLQEA